MTGTLTTYQNNNMSLSCRGVMKIENNIVISLSFKGYPRTNGDGWTGFYKRSNVGDTVTDSQVECIKKYNGIYNVVSKFVAST